MGILIFALRVALGALLLVAGAFKLHDGMAATVASVAGYRILPPFLNNLLGIALPYVELMLGGYLVAGLFTRVVAWIVAAQFVLFAGAVASLVVRHIPADCGCFGSSIPTPPTWGHVGVDLLLALAAAAVAHFGPGRLAVDHRLAGGAGTA